MKIVKINLAIAPNQSLIYEDEKNSYNLRIYQGKNKTTLADVKINDIDVVLGTIVLANTPIIPYLYKCKDGNFFIATTNDEDIDYRKFGVNQFLYFGYFND